MMMMIIIIIIIIIRHYVDTGSVEEGYIVIINSSTVKTLKLKKTRQRKSTPPVLPLGTATPQRSQTIGSPGMACFRRQVEKDTKKKITPPAGQDLNGLWEEYASNARTAAQLLKACSHLNGPVRAQ